MIIYAAGAGTKDYRHWAREYGLGKLFSYLVEKRHIIENYKNMMIDSEAHSWNKKTITKKSFGQQKTTQLPDIEVYHREYKQFVKQHKKKGLVFIELDAYGVIETKILDQSFEELKDYNYIRVYHPILDNGTLETMELWIKQGQKYIGIGNDSRYLLKKIFNLTRNKIKIHGFAMNDIRLLEEYPFYSVDSMSPLSSQMWGAVYHKDGQYSKERLVRERHPLILSTVANNIKLSLEYFGQMQEYYTQLWKARGVKWLT